MHQVVATVGVLWPVVARRDREREAIPLASSVVCRPRDEVVPFGLRTKRKASSERSMEFGIAGSASLLKRLGNSLASRRSGNGRSWMSSGASQRRIRQRLRSLSTMTQWRTFADHAHESGPSWADVVVSPPARTSTFPTDSENPAVLPSSKTAWSP